MDNIKQALFSKAQQVLQSSYSPYSKYKVGACLLTSTNKMYAGTNIENASYGLTLCAEAAAIAHMIAAGDNKIKALLVMANHDSMCSPCGACRQRIAEFSNEQTLVYMCNAHKIIETTTIKALLPYTFENKNIQR